MEDKLILGRATPVNDYDMRPLLMNAMDSIDKRLERLEKKLEKIEKLLLEIQQPSVKDNGIKTDEAEIEVKTSEKGK